MSGVLHLLRLSGAASIQDGGRPGFLRDGLSASGPMDRLAHTAANILVGNPPEAAAIELGLASATLRAEGGPVRLALAGACGPLHRDGEPLADHRSFVLREGAELTLGRPRAGVFATLAVAGGFALRPVLGSVALHRRAGIGGLDGRPLSEGDRLPLAGSAPAGEADLCLDPVPLERDRPIRVVLGPQDDHFAPEGLATFLNGTFTVSGQADRMGYGLDGPAIAHGATGFNIVSDATVMGSVQVPGTGRPIVLMADRQTTGGYPKIATVISSDLRRIAQRRPGEAVRFEAVDLGIARGLANSCAKASKLMMENIHRVEAELDRLIRANIAGNVVDALDDLL